MRKHEYRKTGEILSCFAIFIRAAAAVLFYCKIISYIGGNYKEHQGHKDFVFGLARNLSSKK